MLINTTVGVADGCLGAQGGTLTGPGGTRSSVPTVGDAARALTAATGTGGAACPGDGTGPGLCSPDPFPRASLPVRVPSAGGSGLPGPGRAHGCSLPRHVQVLPRQSHPFANFTCLPKGGACLRKRLLLLMATYGPVVALVPKFLISSQYNTKHVLETRPCVCWTLYYMFRVFTSMRSSGTVSVV